MMSILPRPTVRERSVPRDFFQGFPLVNLQVTKRPRHCQLCRARCSCRRRRRQIFSSADEEVPVRLGPAATTTCRSADSSEIPSAMRTTIAARANLDLIDQNYARWQEDPASVDPNEENEAVIATREKRLLAFIDFNLALRSEPSLPAWLPL